MRPQLFLVACSGLLLVLLPRVEADCTAKPNCTIEADAATQPLHTIDQKCRNLALYNACLTRNPPCTNASAEITTKKANLSEPVCEGDNCSTSSVCNGTNQECANNTCKCMAAYKPMEGICMAKRINDSCSGSCGGVMDCTSSKCTCKSGEGDNGKGECGTSCAPGFKGMVNTTCSLKIVGDNCTVGDNQTCPVPMTCAGGKCACPSSQRDNGMGLCAVNCTTGYGDNGRGLCAMACATGMKGSVGSCTEVQVNDNCTLSDNSTCGTNQWCRGVQGNATCACSPSHTPGSNRLCVAKKPGDPCTVGNDGTCGPNQTCKSGNTCGCKVSYKETSNSCVASGAAGLLLSLCLHFLPLGVVLAVSKWL